MSLLPFGWIPIVWGAFTPHSPVYLWVCAGIISCAVVLSGAVVAGMKDDPDRWGATGLLIGLGVVLGAIWPIIVIGLPFVAVLLGLFFLGYSSMQKIDEESE